jgi:restriction system protein
VEQDRQIDEFAKAFEEGEADAICDYFELVLQCSLYPDGFHKRSQIAYAKESRQLVVDYQLPTVDEIVPAVQVNWKQRARHLVYGNVIASTVLRTIHEITQSDRYKYVDVVTINAFVETIDRGTGHQIHPYVLSVRATRDEIERLNLRQVDPSACLKRLTATVSRSPAELVPIKPIVDINLFDRRFVQEQNIIAGLDNRTNLMTLSPGEFESLITNLFQKMGLETKLRQPSRDGGVDCVAFDQRPILGGRVVVQAKRYRNTVGVGSVRDLFGTMINDGASKSILVTTSGYGKASFEFANGKPIELISGSNLLYLLREHAGVDAKIEPPEDWVDFQDASQ